MINLVAAIVLVNVFTIVTLFVIFRLELKRVADINMTIAVVLMTLGVVMWLTESMTNIESTPLMLLLVGFANLAPALFASMCAAGQKSNEVTRERATSKQLSAHRS